MLGVILHNGERDHKRKNRRLLKLTSFAAIRSHPSIVDWIHTALRSNSVVLANHSGRMPDSTEVGSSEVAGDNTPSGKLSRTDGQPDQRVN